MHSPTTTSTWFFVWLDIPISRFHPFEIRFDSGEETGAPDDLSWRSMSERATIPNLWGGDGHATGAAPVMADDVVGSFASAAAASGSEIALTINELTKSYGATLALQRVSL